MGERRANEVSAPLLMATVACAALPGAVFYLATWGFFPFAPAAAWVALPALLVLFGLFSRDVVFRPERAIVWAAGIGGALLANLIFDVVRLTAVALGLMPQGLLSFIGEQIAGGTRPVAATFVTFTYNYLFMVLPWGAAYGLLAAGRGLWWGGLLGGVLWLLMMIDPLLTAKIGLFGYPHHLLLALMTLVMHGVWGVGLAWLTNRFYRRGLQARAGEHP